MWGSFKFQRNCKFSVFYRYLCNNGYIEAPWFSSCHVRNLTWFPRSHSSVPRINVKRFNRSLVEQTEDEVDDTLINQNSSTFAKTISKYKLAGLQHDTIISSLNLCTSVQEQVKKFCELLQISAKEVEERLKLRECIEQTLKPYFPSCRIQLVGSSITGFGLKGCDIDLLFETDWDPSLRERSCTGENLPTVEEIEGGTVPVSKLQGHSPKMQLRFARRILFKYCGELCKNTIRLLPGRCPILQFYYGPDNLSCDIAFSNRPARSSSRLLLFCGKLDERIIPLYKIVNYWAKHNSLVGPQMFKSYALSLMIFYFLQTRDPPVLPPIRYILEADFFKHEDSKNYEITDDLNSFYKSENTQPVDELLREFFFFYLSFDFNYVICPFTGEVVNKKTLKETSKEFELTTISIQDPIELTWNVATSTSYKNCMLFRKANIAVCKLYQDKALWSQSENNVWGLAALINHCYLSDTNKERSFSLNIPLNVSTKIHSDLVRLQLRKASNAVLEVMRNSLLFECTILDNPTLHLESNNNNNVELIGNTDIHFTDCNTSFEKLSASQLTEVKTLKSNVVEHVPLCKVHCVARNSWDGPHLQRLKDLTSEKPEHLISLQALQQEKDQKSFEFKCKFSNYEEGCYHFLSVKFAPLQKTYFPPKLASFLKEYLPDVIQKLLK